MHATFQLITFDIPVFVQSLNVMCTKLYLPLSICLCKPSLCQRRFYCFGYGKSFFQFNSQNICVKSCSHLLRSFLQFLV